MRHKNQNKKNKKKRNLNKILKNLMKKKNKNQ